MNPLKLTLAFLLFASSNVFSQANDDLTAISKSLSKVLISNFTSRKCQAIDLTTSILVITFNRKGTVKNIKPYNLPNCIATDTLNFINQLKEKINTLSLHAKDYRNKCIISPILFIKEEESWDATKMREKWMSDLSFQVFQMDRRELKFVIPITIQLYPTLRKSPASEGNLN